MSSGWLDHIFTLPIDHALLMRANDAVNARRGEDLAHEPGYAMFSVASALRGVAEPGIVAAVYFRLEALAHLLKNGDADAWVLGQDVDGGQLINEAVFIAAAQAPITADGANAVRFDPGVFQRFALEAAESEGKA